MDILFSQKFKSVLKCILSPQKIIYLLCVMYQVCFVTDEKVVVTSSLTSFYFDGRIFDLLFTWKIK